MRYRRILLAALALAISACSGLGGLSDDSQQQRLWAQQQIAAAGVREWDMYARGALSLKGEAYNVGIRWQRDIGGRFMMLLEAPFGQGVFRIDAIEPGVYELLLPDGALFTNSTAEALLQDVVGWSLPISGLDYWVRGLPRPDGSYSHRVDSGGRARSIRQDGWDIAYLDYFDAADKPALPRRLRLQGETVTLKLVIERWQPAQLRSDDADLFPSFN